MTSLAALEARLARVEAALGAGAVVDSDADSLATRVAALEAALPHLPLERLRALEDGTLQPNSNAHRIHISPHSTHAPLTMRADVAAGDASSVHLAQAHALLALDRPTLRTQLAQVSC